jgi:hypothetical protein
MAETFKRGLENLQNKTKSALDLTPLMVKVEDLKKKTHGLNKAIGKTLMALKGKKKNIQAINTMTLSALIMLRRSFRCLPP